MAGLNQTLMLALSMTVIAALIGAGGLGLTVYTGLGRLDVGTAAEGGIGIVLIAIILDRITQALGEQQQVKSPSLLDTLRSLFRPRMPAPEQVGGGARSDQRRVGQDAVRTCNSRCAPSQ